MRIFKNPQSIGLSICLLLSGLNQVSKAEENPLPDAIGDLSISIQDIDGRERFPFRTGDAKAVVLLFVTQDCPISNAYARELARLKSEFGPEGFKLTLVYVDPDVSDEAVAKHMKDFRLTGFVAIADRGHTLVKAAGASVTPEAVVALSSGVIAYRGRIDNMYPALGDRRRVITEKDLRKALDAIKDNREIPVARTQAVGCYIPNL